MDDAGYAIEVALVDDQDLFRSGIRMLVESQSDMTVVSEARDGEEAVALAAEHQPEVILMDLRMPVLDGVGATRRIMEAAAQKGIALPKIVALTTFNRDQAVIDAVQAGASGYLLKSAEPEFLLSAIRTVYAGYSVIAPGSVTDLFANSRPKTCRIEPDFSAIEGLSRREQDLFVLAAKGLSNTELAGRLFVSEATVKSHLRNVLSKLGLQTRIQLIAFAYEHNLVS